MKNFIDFYFGLLASSRPKIHQSPRSDTAAPATIFDQSAGAKLAKPKTQGDIKTQRPNITAAFPNQ